MDVYQHFRDDEKPFIDEVLHWRDEAEEHYVPKLTDFLDPRQQDIAASVVSDELDITLSFCGGVENTERKRLLICPPYYERQPEDCQLAFFAVEYPRKFATISHRELLGSLMGLGLKREKFGDLLFQDDSIQLVVADEVANYVKLNLTKVGNTPIELKEISVSDLIQPEEKWDEQSGTISSLRLDTVLAEIYHLSRAKVAPLIENGRVKVNWKVVEQTSFSLKEGDHLSIRGFGRSKLIDIQGKTKKNKWRVLYGKKFSY